MMRPLLSMLVLLPLLCVPASAQVGVAEIRAQLFLEQSGGLSKNLVGSDAALHNTIIGGGDAGEPANSVLVTLVFTGPKNLRSSDTNAREFATVTVRQKLRAGDKLLLRRSFRGLLFGEEGRVQKPLLLHDVTCAPLEIEARAGGASKIARIDFHCGE